jgi:hypothetical protein
MVTSFQHAFKGEERIIDRLAGGWPEEPRALKDRERAVRPVSPPSVPGQGNCLGNVYTRCDDVRCTAQKYATV